MSLTEVESGAVDAGLEPKQEIAGKSPWLLAIRRLRQDKASMISLVVIVILVLAALLAPLISHWTGQAFDIGDRKYGLDRDGLPYGPSSRHWFGTDALGRDVFIRTLYGARVSLLVGVLATAIATAAGVVVGLLSGYFGGPIDTVLARFIDVVLSFPYLIFAIALVAILGPSLWVTILVIAFFNWAAMARIVRGQTLSLKEKEYVEAARSLGGSDARIMFVEIMPNVLAPVIVLASLMIPIAIVFEATLSYVGLGIVPPTASWGNMLSDSLRTYQVAWWTLIIPAGFLLITTVAFNLLGDGVRDSLDPRTERIFAMKRKKNRKAVEEQEADARA